MHPYSSTGSGRGLALLLVSKGVGMAGAKLCQIGAYQLRLIRAPILYSKSLFTCRSMDERFLSCFFEKQSIVSQLAVIGGHREC